MLVDDQYIVTPIQQFTHAAVFLAKVLAPSQTNLLHLTKQIESMNDERNPADGTKSPGTYLTKLCGSVIYKFD